MTRAQKKALAAHRRRMKAKGFARVELRVPKGDVPLIRSLADALGSPEQARETRALLRKRFPLRAAKGLKALLAEAPLEGVDLTRKRDLGRTVKL